MTERSNASYIVTTKGNYEISEGFVAYLMQRAVIFLGFVAAVVLAVWFVVHGQPAATQFRFNAYSLLTAIGCISIFGALFVVARVKRHSTMLTWLSMLLMSLGVWSGTEFMLRISATPETARYWAPISTIGSAFIPLTLYMFSLSYTNSRRRQQPLVFLSMLATSLLFIYIDLRTESIDNFAAATLPLKPWGYTIPSGPIYGLFSSWFLLLGAASVIQLFYFWRNTTEPVMRTQARLILLSVALPLVVGGVTDAVLPSFHIDSLPPTGAVLTTLMGVVISYGVIRYRYFNFTPDAVAEQILTTMNEAVVGVGSDLRVSYINPGAVRMFGFSRDAFFRMHFNGLFSQKIHINETQAMFNKVLADRGYGTIDSVEFRTADGTPITVKLSITKVMDEGQPYGYLVVLTDITTIAKATSIIEQQVAAQTQAVREAKAQLLNSINSLEFGFMITDQSPRIVMVNNVAHDLFCGSHDHDAAVCEMVTLDHIERRHISGVHLTDAVRKCIDRRHMQLIKSVVFDNRTWRVFVSPMIDNDVVAGTAVIVQDVTEEHILARSRDEFFSIASHELRTPLTAIKGNASLMLQYYNASLKDPSLREMVEDIHESSERLIGIVNDFLDVSRLEQGRITFQLESVSVSKIAEKIVYDMGATAKQSDVHIRLGEGLNQHGAIPDVIADPGRLKQILYNLVGNAVKFTEHGDITISAAVTEKFLKVTVADSGRGIAPDMQPLLFHKFQQAGESLLTRDSSKGTGLGLYISRLLARGMHGQLVLEKSIPGKGSEFLLTLPLATPARLLRLHDASHAATMSSTNE
jgi:PAS domain S-box-containing protein